MTEIQPEVIKKIQHLPTLPTVLTQLMATLEDENASAAKLEEIIRYDPSLTAKILAVANSSFYGFREEIVTVKRAVVALGLDELRGICLGAGLVSYLHPKGFDNRERAEKLWLHSLATAVGALLAAEKGNLGDPGRAFTAGLLHDLGKIVLAANFPHLADQLADLAESQQVSVERAETALGLDHCRIGSLLALHWQLPAMLAESILRHHDPAPDQTWFELTCCSHIGDQLARACAMGFTGDPEPPAFAPEAVKRLELGEAGLKELQKGLAERRQAIEVLWSAMVQG